MIPNLADIPSNYIGAALCLVITVWFTFLTVAGGWVWASYNLAILRTPPRWAHLVGDMPFQVFTAVFQHMS